MSATPQGARPPVNAPVQALGDSGVAPPRETPAPRPATDPDADATLDPVAAARLDGVRLAGRTIAHLVNNDLTITVGALDLLRAHGDLPPHLHTLLDTALDALFAATDHIDQVRHVTRVVLTDSPAGPALDLDRSRDTPPEPYPSSSLSR
jgi:hypothetical protein